MWKWKPHQKPFPSTKEQIQSTVNKASQSPVSLSVKSLPAWIGTILFLLVMVLCIFPPPFDWAGMRESETRSQVTKEEVGGKTTKTTTTIRIEPTKTFWNWMSLLLAPATLAGLGFLFQSSLEKAKESKEKADKEREADQQREQALQSYLNEISALLVDKGLKKLLSEGEQEQPKTTQAIDPNVALGVVKARTLALLRLFDNDIQRKSSVLSFLGDTQLLPALDLDLSSFHWEKANLSRVSLSGTCLRKVFLSGANLSFANLSGANLFNADLSGANLSMANLIDANLYMADLTGADLHRANLGGAKGNLSKAVLSGANLTFADLTFVNLSGAVLTDAILDNVNLSGATLFNADLSNAYLSGANFNNTDLTDASLSGAILLTTDLRAQWLDKKQLEGKDSPLLCNVALSKEIAINPNRDCDLIPKVLHNRYPENFKTLKDAKDFVDKVCQQKKWD